MGGDEFTLIGAARGHGEFDAPHAGAHQRADFEELEADRAAGGSGELGVVEGNATQRAEQYIGHRGKPQAQLVGAHRRRRGAVGEQIELTLLDAVFHIAAGAVDLLVEPLRLGLLAAERGDNKAGIGFAPCPFGLSNDPALAAPAVARRPGELLKTACRLAGGFAVLFGRGELGGNLADQTRVLGQAKQLIRASRANPESARSTMRTCGQRARIWVTMRAVSSTAPADASMSARRSFDANRCAPQKIYSGR